MYKNVVMLKPGVPLFQHPYQKGTRLNKQSGFRIHVRDGAAKGFTLIELLVVVLIIGILSAVALPQYQKAVDKARAAEAFMGLKSLSDASNVYYLANGSYTGMDQELLDVQLPEASKNFVLKIGGSAIYEPNHMDIIAEDRRGKYILVAVHYNGQRTRLYCRASDFSDIGICRSLGAYDCTEERECNLPQY